MDVLVTGASGFVGRNFILRSPTDWRILALYHKDASFSEFVSRLNKPNVTAVRCDLASQEEVASLFERHGRDWECCLYLAGKVDIPWSVQEPKQDLLINVCPLLHVLDCLRARRFVYFSSGAVYDGLQGEVQTNAQLSPTLPYAISKLTCERYVQFYSHRKRSIEKYLIVRFFGAYGPYEAPHKIYTRLVLALALEGKGSYTIYGSGQNLIDAMYVEDAVDAIQRMLTANHWDVTVNLAGGHPRTIEALVREVGEALGVGSLCIEKEGVAHESNQFWGSTREMQDLFGFEAQVGLSAGVRRFASFLGSQNKALEAPNP
jgi:nucleoside-diphosphate-sugar epimerase